MFMDMQCVTLTLATKTFITSLIHFTQEKWQRESIYMNILIHNYIIYFKTPYLKSAYLKNNKTMNNHRLGANLLKTADKEAVYIAGLKYRRRRRKYTNR